MRDKIYAYWICLIVCGMIAAGRAGSAAIANGLIESDDKPSFDGSAAGESREVSGMKLRWRPSGRFLMGSPPDEPERRPGEDQVETTLTQGFWMSEFETTQ